MDIRVLKYFLAVAREESITKAAEAGLCIVWKRYQVFSRAAEKFLSQMRSEFSQP